MTNSGNYGKGRLETTCNFPNYGDIANISKVIMMAKKEQCFLKKNRLKKYISDSWR